MTPERNTKELAISAWNRRSSPRLEAGRPCLLWSGAVPNEHGKVSIDGATVSAHRASYRIFNGKIPKGMFVCHKCDNPPCVEPTHLFLGTVKDNAIDCVEKGRHPATKKTHCPSGHDYGVFGRRGGNGARHCAECKSIQGKKYRKNATESKKEWIRSEDRRRYHARQAKAALDREEKS